MYTCTPVNWQIITEASEKYILDHSWGIRSILERKPKISELQMMWENSYEDNLASILNFLI